jgi:hypothetical protein
MSGIKGEIGGIKRSRKRLAYPGQRSSFQFGAKRRLHRGSNSRHAVLLMGAGRGALGVPFA